MNNLKSKYLLSLIGFIAVSVVVFQNCSPGVPVSNDTASVLSSDFVDYTEVAEVEFLSKTFSKNISGTPSELQDSAGAIDFRLNRLTEGSLEAEDLSYEIRSTSQPHTGMDNTEIKIFQNQVGVISFIAGEKSKVVSLHLLSPSEMVTNRLPSRGRIFLLKITSGQKIVADRTIKLKEMSALANTGSGGIDVSFEISLNPARFYALKVDENPEQQICKLCYSTDLVPGTVVGNDPHDNINFFNYDSKRSKQNKVASEGSTLILKGKLEKDYEFNVVGAGSQHKIRTDSNPSAKNDLIIDQSSRQLVITRKLSESLSETYLASITLGVFDILRICSPGQSDCESQFNFETTEFYQLSKLNFQSKIADPNFGKLSPKDWDFSQVEMIKYNGPNQELVSAAMTITGLERYTKLICFGCESVDFWDAASGTYISRGTGQSGISIQHSTESIIVKMPPVAPGAEWGMLMFESADRLRKSPIKSMKTY